MPPAVFLTIMFAQELPAAAGGAANLERIRRALAEPPPIAITSPTSPEGPVFRMNVYAPKPDRPVWEAWSAVPSYVRPSMTLHHHEFLMQVTPEAFRGVTLHPIGVPMVPLLELLGQQISAALRRSAEARAREEVRQALEALVACKAGPARPGCER
jgi:hypothetical protein